MAEGFEKGGFNALVEEIEVIGAGIEDVLDDFFDKFFGEIHVAVDIAEGHFGFDHPELAKVADAVAVFGAEGGAEGVAVGEAEGLGFDVELTGHGEERGFAEKVFGGVGVFESVLGAFGTVFGFELGADGEHCTRAFGIGGGDDGRVNPVESAVVEEFVNGLGGLVSYAHDGAEGVSAYAKVGDFAEEFEGGAFLLEGVGGWVGGAVDGYFFGVELDGLALSGAFDKVAGEHDAGSGGDLLEGFFGDCSGIDDDLEVVEA